MLVAVYVAGLREIRRRLQRFVSNSTPPKLPTGTYFFHIL